MIDQLIAGFYETFPFVPRGLDAWEIVARLPELVSAFVHPDAVVEPGAVLKPPVLIGPGCFVAAHATLRGGVALAAGVTIGPGVEVKASLIGPGSTSRISISSATRSSAAT